MVMGVVMVVAMMLAFVFSAESKTSKGPHFVLLTTIIDDN